MFKAREQTLTGVSGKGRQEMILCWCRCEHHEPNRLDSSDASGPQPPLCRQYRPILSVCGKGRATMPPRPARPLPGFVRSEWQGQSLYARVSLSFAGRAALVPDYFVVTGRLHQRVRRLCIWMSPWAGLQRMRCTKANGALPADWQTWNCFRWFSP